MRLHSLKRINHRGTNEASTEAAAAILFAIKFAPLTKQCALVCHTE